MGEVVGLKAKTGPHLSGPVLCTRCKHTWLGVAPVGEVTGLECPACSMYCGQFRGEIVPDSARWVCTCGNEMFYLTPTGAPLCCNCGLRATSWADG